MVLNYLPRAAWIVVPLCALLIAAADSEAESRPGQPFANASPVDWRSSAAASALRVTTGPPIKRKLPDPMVADRLGVDVAVDGDTAIINAIGNSFVFERDAGGPENWGLVATTSSGISVSISGDTVAIGAPSFRDNRVFIHQRDAGGEDNWGLVKTITRFLRLSRFGYSVSLSGDTLVVGEWGYRLARVFGRDVGGADNWGEIAVLAPPAETCDFGFNVAVSGDTTIVGEPCITTGGVVLGLAHVFQRDAGGADAWGLVGTLSAPDGRPANFFGAFVAVDGDNAAVGAPGADGPAPNTGAAYLFARNGGGTDNWGAVVKMTGFDTLSGEGFGSAVWLRGGRLTARTFKPDDETGVAYVFERNAGGLDAWNQVAGLTSPPGSGADSFGDAAIEGGTVVVGAGGDDEIAADSGSFYVFTLLECGLDQGDNTATTCPCGNGDLDGDEACDDGNTIAGDGCSQTCALESCDDFDGDGFGLLGRPDCPAGTTRDCNDGDDTIHPGAPQRCDGINNDCSAPDWPSIPAAEADDDADGFPTCAGDCDDRDDATYPGAAEICDGVRNDCETPDWPAAPDDEVDGDDDRYFICQGDCDDTDPAVNPGEAETCNAIDDDCNGLIDDDAFGEDTDRDRLRNRCDNCPIGFNPSQTDRDEDGVGDVCDLNDGVIYLLFDVPGIVNWQLESGYETWNLYRGDLDILQAGGPYTQPPGGNPLPAHWCANDDSFVVDTLVPLPQQVAFYLVSGKVGFVESDLGTDGTGTQRPNDNPCPLARRP